MLGRIKLPRIHLSKQPSDLNLFPLDILNKIFEYCGLEYFGLIARICKRFKEIIYSTPVPQIRYDFTCECVIILPPTTYQKLNRALPQLRKYSKLSFQQTPLDHELVYWEEKARHKKTKRYSILFLIGILLLSFITYRFRNPICNTTKLHETDLLGITLMLFLVGSLTLDAIYKNDTKKINNGIRLFKDILTFGYEQKQHLALQ